MIIIYHLSFAVFSFDCAQLDKLLAVFLPRDAMLSSCVDLSVLAKQLIPYVQSNIIW